MSLNDIAVITFSLQNPGVTAAGFGVPLIASPNATWVERTRTYNDITGVAADWGAATPEYLAAQKMFSQSTGLTSLMIGRCANKPTQVFSVGVNSVTAAAIYKLDVSADNGSNVRVDQEADYTATGAVAWTINTVYTQGQLVTNDTGPVKFYLCTTGGTSAGATGPTGVTSSIADNTVVWMYAGTNGVVGQTTNDAIVYGLKLLLDGFAAPALAASNVLAGAVGSKTLTITANTAGAFFGVEVLDMSFLSLAQTQADPGIATDLDAIAKASTAWYGLVTLFNSSAIISAAAAWAEANEKLYIAGTQDSLVATQALGVGTDIAQTLKSASYARTGLIFHPANDDFASAAEIARWFPIDPGADDWRLKTLAGVTTKQYSATQVTNLVAKYCNYYSTLGTANVVQGEGKVSANEYIDIIRGRDWYKARLQVRLVNLLIQNEKVPFDLDGLAMVETQIKAQNDEGVAAKLIAPDSPDTPITVTLPALSAITSSDKLARWLRGNLTSWTFAGAIHKISVTVQATE